MRALTCGINVLEPLWSAAIQGEPASALPVFCDDGSILVGSQKSYQRVDGQTGRTLWSTPLEPDEKLMPGEPVLMGDTLAVNTYFKDSSFMGYSGALVGLDANTGKIRFRVRGEYTSEFHTDRAGNVYFGTDHGGLRRVSPQGVDVHLQADRTSSSSLSELRVTPDGTAFYRVVDTMDFSVNGLYFWDGIEEKRVLESMPSSIETTPDGGACASMDYCDVTRFTPAGTVAWHRKEAFPTDIISVGRDNSVTALTACGSGQAKGVVRFDVNGNEVWRFDVGQPLLPAGGPAPRWQLLARPDGGVLVMETTRGAVMAIGADGKERWRRAAQSEEMSCPGMTVTRDDKLYIGINGGFERIDLLTGRTEVAYDPKTRIFTRSPEGQAPWTIPVANGPTFEGPIVQGEPDVIVTRDGSNRLAAYRLPRHLSEAMGPLDDGCRPAGGRVEQLDGYVRIGGVLVPVRRDRD